MAIVATGSTTIIDLSDGKSLSAYLGSNQPRTQIYDANESTYTPDWATGAGKLVITPVVYANQIAIALSDAALSIAWKRKDGSGAETNLNTGETVSGNILTVNTNKLGDSTSKLVTYVAYVTYNDPDTGMPINAMTDISFALVQTGANAKSCFVSGEQVFKYDSTNEATPGQITLSANVQHCAVSKWMYRAEGGLWQDYPTTADNATIAGTTLVVKPTHAIWVGDMATIKVTTDDANIEDIMTIYKVRDGLDGTIGSSAPMAFLSNESIQFIGDGSGQVSATTKTCNVIAYHGTEKVTPTVGSITGTPAGMTVEVLAAVNHEVPIKITIASKATLGGAGQQQGVLNVPVTSPVNTTYAVFCLVQSVGCR